MTETATAAPSAPTNSADAASVSAQPAAAPAAAATQGESQQQATAVQGQQADTANAGGDKAADKAPSGAPDKYEFKAPEGHTYDPQILSAFSETAKSLNLTQEAAQQFLDSMAPAVAQRQQAQIEAIRTEWVSKANSDAEIGGDQMPQRLSVARKALDAFGTPELRELLNESGLGNHPEIIRAFYRAGKAISEDTYVGGSAGSGKPAPKDFGQTAAALYPNQSST
jgi:hypothetical protein